MNQFIIRTQRNVLKETSRFAIESRKECKSKNTIKVKRSRINFTQITYENIQYV